MNTTMQSKKLRVAILFGGRSAEHEVSLQSANNVIAAMDKDKFDPVLIGIDRKGRWFHNTGLLPLLQNEEPQFLGVTPDNTVQVALTADGIDRSVISKNSNTVISNIDVIFPVLHGPYGEDGSIQGLAKLANLPCVGSDILGSAVGMDKEVMKRLLREAQINVGPFLVFKSEREAREGFEETLSRLGNDVFIKPANLGSSVGITHARSRAEYVLGVANAFQYDTKIIVEKTIKGREIEIAVLGNNNPIASLPGEIINHTDFYSYESKYIDEHGATLLIPAPIDEWLTTHFKQLALKTYQTLCCKGMARVDFFLTSDGEIYVNEINTLPGFTAVSMYPKLWEASGISYQDLITQLIDLSLEDFEEREKLKSKPDEIR